MEEKKHKDHYHPNTKLRAADVLLILAAGALDYGGVQSLAMARLHEAGHVPHRLHDARLSNKINGLAHLVDDFSGWLASQKAPGPEMAADSMPVPAASLSRAWNSGLGGEGGADYG